MTVLLHTSVGWFHPCLYHDADTDAHLQAVAKAFHANRWFLADRHVPFDGSHHIDNAGPKCRLTPCYDILRGMLLHCRVVKVTLLYIRNVHAISISLCPEWAARGHRLRSAQLRLSSAQLNSTRLNSTQLNSTQLSSPQLSSAQLTSAELMSLPTKLPYLIRLSLQWLVWRSRQRWCDVPETVSTSGRPTTLASNPDWHPRVAQFV